MISANGGKCEKELVSFDDFERLLEERDICTDSEDRKNESNFIEMFKEISGGDNDPMNESKGDHPNENFDKNSEDLICGTTNPSGNVDMERNLEEKKTCLNDAKFEGDGVQLAKDNDETTIEESDDSGSCEIFPSHIPQKYSNADPIEVCNPNTHAPLIVSQVSHEDKHVHLTIHQALEEEKDSCQTQIKLKEREISELMQDFQKLKDRKTESSIGKNLSSDRKDEALLSEVNVLKERVKVQDAIIDEMRKENTRLSIDNKGIEEAVEHGNADQNNEEKDLKHKIMLLEHELDDQREVHKQLKAYVGEVLSNIMMTNPQVLERK